MMCCGQMRTTCFCPDCGKKLTEDPLVQLLAYVRTLEKSAKTRVESQVKEAERQEDQKKKDQYNRKTVKISKKVDKLTSWRSALENAISIVNKQKEGTR